jgi:broad specificity phosphatase PhoE
MNKDKWPEMLWVVRHGQSAGNVARDLAEAQGDAVIDIAHRDIDTPLSALGEEQSIALCRWFGALPAGQQPQVILCSPYVRALDSARLLLEAAGLARDKVVFRVDERLRDKEFGILDRLTRHGIEARHPELATQFSHVGKFYFRPPGGESWCDVILRLRSLVEMISREHSGERVLIVAHQVIVNCMRYLIESLDEQTILALDREGDVPNCGVTSYVFDPSLASHGGLALQSANWVAPLQDAGAPVTRGKDVPAAAKP